MVIVQSAQRNPKPTKDIKTTELKPYQNDKESPYITAYLNADDLPLNFVIGDGKEYNSGNERYFNKPLQRNSSQIVFLRYFESKVHQTNSVRIIFFYLKGMSKTASEMILS